MTAPYFPLFPAMKTTLRAQSPHVSTVTRKTACILLIAAIIGFVSCASQSSESRVASARTNVVWKRYAAISPVVHYQIRALTFPRPNHASPNCASSDVFADVRKRIAEIESLDVVGIDPRVAAHIRRSTVFWSKIASLQPELEARTQQLYSGGEENAVKGMRQGFKFSEGDSIASRGLTTALGGVLGMMGSINKIESIFRAHVAAHGREALDIVTEEERLCRRYGTPNEGVSRSVEVLKSAVLGSSN